MIESPRYKSVVLPVIDLKQGSVVRGIAGRRDEYRAVESCFAADARPASVARGLVERFAFHTAYVADLDAIAGAEPDWNSLQQIAAAGLRLLIDAGLSDARRGKRMAAAGSCLGSAAAGWIAGLESIDGPHELAGIVSAMGAERAVFSLDLERGQPLNRNPAWQASAPLQIAGSAVRAGFRRLIVLDLAAVGVDGGPLALDLCRSIRQTYPGIELISGGGVRQATDLEAFDEGGCNAVLVASALHAGRIRPPDLADRIGG